MTDTPKYYSTNKVGEMFGVSNYTIRTWIKLGKLRGVMINGRWKISHDEIMRLGKERHGE